MAITRAQQAKQMLREGGRIGLRNGSYDSPAQSFKDSVPESSYDSPTQSFKDSVPESSYDAPTGAVDDKFKGRGQSPDYFTTTNTTGYDEEVGVTTPPRNTDGRDDVIPSGGRNNDLMTFRNTPPKKSNFPGLLGFGVNALNAIFPNLRKRNIDYFLDNKSINRSEYPTTIEGYKKYMKDRSSGVIDASGRDIIDREGRDDPIMVGNMFNQNQGMGDNNTEDQESEEPFVPNFRLLADGGMPEDAPVYEGGIMDLESARQMYGLGKLVKKITRSVKKVAKSPIGKEALLYFGGNALAGGGLKSFLLGSNAGPNFSKTGLLQKMFLKNPSLGFSLGNLSGGAIAGVPAALSYFMTPKEEDSDEELYLGPELDMKAIENKPMDFINYRNRADGGIMRAGYEEGGDAEPVAKKTMPLLDMDGMEKDYREDGGFVPIGRMEKADDVPARLSKNEFVFTADAVRNAGEGDIDKGAEVMYNMMKNLESGGEVSEESQGLDGAREMFQTSQRLGEVL